jgi:hypothetical protein
MLFVGYSGLTPWQSTREGFARDHLLFHCTQLHLFKQDENQLYTSNKKHKYCILMTV